jgi:hypothetical protein
MHARALRHVRCVEDLHRFAYPGHSASRRSDRLRRGDPGSGSPSGRATWGSSPGRLRSEYVTVGSTRQSSRTMKRITVREGSVKQFLDEIHKAGLPLWFRHRGDLSTAARRHRGFRGSARTCTRRPRKFQIRPDQAPAGCSATTVTGGAIASSTWSRRPSSSPPASIAVSRSSETATRSHM